MLTEMQIVKMLAAGAVPLAMYFSFRRVPFFKKKPLYFSQAIAVTTTLAAYFIYKA